MAAQQPKGRKAADQQAGKFVKASVLIDVSTYARVSAAAVMAGVDKSAFMSRAISESVRGLVLFDRRKSADHVDLSSEGVSAKADEAV